jgi:hypothetical protein
MPFTDGVFSRVHDWTTDRDNQIKIDADRMDAEDDGFAAAINAILDGTQGALDGAVGGPTIRFHGDADSGLYLEGDGVIGLTIAGTKEIEFKAGIVNVINELQVGGQPVSSLPAFTASGAVANATVVILNNDGTVSEVSETATDAAFGGEDTVASKTATDDGRMVCSLGSGKFFFVYHNTSGPQMHAKIGTFDGENWSFGAEVNIDSTSVVSARSVYCSYDSTADRVIVAFDYGNNVRTYVCSVSGTTITVNTGQDIVGATGDVISLATNNGYAVFVYSDSAVRAICASIGSTSLSAGGEITLETGLGGSFNLDVMPTFTDDLFVAIYETNSILKVHFIERTSSSTISAGTASTAINTDISYASCCSISDGYVLVTARKNASPFDQIFCVVEHTGTTVNTVGTAVEDLLPDYAAGALSAVVPNQIDAAYIALLDASGYLAFVEITHSGTVPSAGTPVVMKSETGWYTKGADWDSSDGTIAFMAAKSASISVFDVAAAGVTTDAGDWLGISQNAADDAASVRVAINGNIADGLTGLTIDTIYYVDDDGTLTTSSVGGRKIGRATATTKLQITEDNVA